MRAVSANILNLRRSRFSERRRWPVRVWCRKKSWRSLSHLVFDLREASMSVEAALFMAACRSWLLPDSCIFCNYTCARTLCPSSNWTPLYWYWLQPFVHDWSSVEHLCGQMLFLSTRESSRWTTSVLCPFSDFQVKSVSLCWLPADAVVITLPGLRAVHSIAVTVLLCLCVHTDISNITHPNFT